MHPVPVRGEPDCLCLRRRPLMCGEIATMRPRGGCASYPPTAAGRRRTVSAGAPPPHQQFAGGVSCQRTWTLFPEKALLEESDYQHASSPASRSSCSDISSDRSGGASAIPLASHRPTSRQSTPPDADASIRVVFALASATLPLPGPDRSLHRPGSVQLSRVVVGSCAGAGRCAGAVFGDWVFQCV